jgi:hypothetical protein
MKSLCITTLLSVCVASILSCNGTPTYFSKPIFDSDQKHIGDSIFSDNLIEKIIFTDSTYEIDSVVFSRYNNAARTIKAINTFMGGKVVFENNEYFENGNIKKYKFIDEDNSHCFYERLYNVNGKLMKSRGYLFFQGYIVDTVHPGIKIKKGTTIAYRIYYPNPPDCYSKVYITDETGVKYDVFKKSNFINFLQTVKQDNDEVGFYKATILLEMIDKSADTTMRFKQDAILEVVQ